MFEPHSPPSSAGGRRHGQRYQHAHPRQTGRGTAPLEPPVLPAACGLGVTARWWPVTRRPQVAAARRSFSELTLLSESTVRFLTTVPRRCWQCGVGGTGHLALASTLSVVARGCHSTRQQLHHRRRREGTSHALYVSASSTDTEPPVPTTPVERARKRRLSTPTLGTGYFVG